MLLAHSFLAGNFREATLPQGWKVKTNNTRAGLPCRFQAGSVHCQSPVCVCVSPCTRGSKKNQPKGLNASFPTFVPMRVLWMHWSGPALGGTSVDAFIWDTPRPLRKADMALLGHWRGQGSARRQRPVPLSVSWAEPPSCGQNAVECNLERQNSSGGEEQGVLRHAPTLTAKTQVLG